MAQRPISLPRVAVRFATRSDLQPPSPAAGSCRVLLCDNYNSFNRGDAAILEGMLQSLGRALPTPSFLVTSSFPEIAERTHGVPALDSLVSRKSSPVAILSWVVRSYAWVRRRRGRRLPAPSLSVEEESLLSSYDEADLVIGVGGSYLRSGYHRAWLRLWHLYLATLLGKPVMLYGQSLGPFSFRDPLRAWARYVLQRLDVITLRDAASLATLQQLGVTRPAMEVTADAALALAPPPPRQGSPRSQLRVGVSVVHWHLFRRARGFEHYRDALAVTLDSLVEKEYASITFLSTTVAPRGSKMNVSGNRIDDVAAARAVVSTMKHRESVVIQEEPRTLRELWSEIAQFDLWIGTRMHSTIFSTKARVPTVAIAYEPKTWGYFGLLDLTSFVVDIEKISPEKLGSIAISAVRRRHEIETRLANRLPALEQRAHRNAAIAARLLQDSRSKSPITSLGCVPP